MDPLKEAFQKIKQDIEFLRFSMEEFAKEMLVVQEELKKVKENEENYRSTDPTNPPINPTQTPLLPTNPTQIQHINQLYTPLKTQNMIFSTGNEGVPTDRQTDQQTDRHIKNNQFFQENSQKTMRDSLEILNSLDSIKKEIRLKFKNLTEQEMLVFSAIYQMDEEIGFSDYKSLSQKLGLTESSIRDYAGRLIKKGIPVDKIKLNNKTINLHISKNLKNLVSLQTIFQLREI